MTSRALLVAIAVHLLLLLLAALSVCLDVEVGEEDDEDERVEEDPVAEDHGIFAVLHEEQLRAVHDAQQELRLKCKQ